MDIQEIFEKNYIDLNAICNSILEGVVIASASKNFLFWNEAAKDILEDEPDTANVYQWAERYRLYDPATHEYLAYDDLPMVRALNGEEFYDYRVMTKNLTHPEGIIISVNGKPLRSGNATIAAITTFRDISKQIKQEKLIQNERNFYERILDLMPGIVFIKDTRGKFVYGNNSFHELLGDKSVVGKTSDHYLVKAMADIVYNHDKIVMRSGVPHDFEEIIHWKDGTKSTFLTTRFPYLGENGELKGVCAVSKDMTQEIETQAALAHERNRSAQISKHAAIGVLSAEIAHEIKNPLTILRSASDVLQSALGDEIIDREFMKGKLKVINETIDRMNKVASSLGALSRDGNLEKDGTSTIREIVDNVKSLCSFKTRKLNMEIVIKESDALDTKITCNQVQISEVVLNLVMNALDAVEGEKNPEIKFCVSHEANSLFCRVWDNGRGVPENIKDKIFEPFFTTKGHLHGTGLGLSISRKIAEKHNGSLYYEDTGPGHCFVLKMPIYN